MHTVPLEPWALSFGVACPILAALFNANGEADNLLLVRPWEDSAVEAGYVTAICRHNQ